MLISWKRFGIGASWSIGVWFVRYGARVLALRASWDSPLFSELHGGQMTLLSCCGWRLLWRRKGFAMEPRPWRLGSKTSIKIRITDWLKDGRHLGTLSLDVAEAKALMVLLGVACDADTEFYASVQLVGWEAAEPPGGE